MSCHVRIKKKKTNKKKLSLVKENVHVRTKLSLVKENVHVRTKLSLVKENVHVRTKCLDLFRTTKYSVAPRRSIKG